MHKYSETAVAMLQKTIQNIHFCQILVKQIILEHWSLFKQIQNFIGDLSQKPSKVKFGRTLTVPREYPVYESVEDISESSLSENEAHENKEKTLPASLERKYVIIDVGGERFQVVKLQFSLIRTICHNYQFYKQELYVFRCDKTSPLNVSTHQDLHVL